MNCTVRITALIASAGVLTPTSQGLLFDSPQATLEFNGKRHSIQDCLLTVPAMHYLHIDGMPYADISGAELHVRFKGETVATQNSLYTVVLPIKLAETGAGVDFFASLGSLQRSRPTLGSVLREDTPMLLYRGTDLEGRTKSAAVAAGATEPRCEDTVNKVNYLVALKPLSMRQGDLTRFRRLLTSPTYTTGPIQATDANRPNLKINLITYISSIKVTSATKATAKKTIQNGYVETEQVKCRPLDRSRDISGNMIYVGGPGGYTTLKSELDGTVAGRMAGLEEPDVSTDVSRIETIMAITFGIVLSVAVIGVAVWWWFNRSEAKYNKNILVQALSYVPDLKSITESAKKGYAKNMLTAATAAAEAASK